MVFISRQLSRKESKISPEDYLKQYASDVIFDNSQSQEEEEQ